VKLNRDYALMAAMTYGAVLTLGTDGTYLLSLTTDNEVSRHSTRDLAIRKLTRLGKQLRPNHVHLYTSAKGRLRWALNHGIRNYTSNSVCTSLGPRRYSGTNATKMDALDDLISQLRDER
jgi:hypothetical protein